MTKGPSDPTRNIGNSDVVFKTITDDIYFDMYTFFGIYIYILFLRILWSNKQYFNNINKQVSGWRNQCIGWNRITGWTAFYHCAHGFCQEILNSVDSILAPFNIFSSYGTKTWLCSTIPQRFLNAGLVMQDCLELLAEPNQHLRKSAC